MLFLGAFVTAFDYGLPAETPSVIVHQRQQLALFLSGFASLIGGAGVALDRRTLLWGAVLLVAGLAAVVAISFGTVGFVPWMGSLQFAAAALALVIRLLARRP